MLSQGTRQKQNLQLYERILEYDITIQMAKERGRAPGAQEKTSGLLWLCLWEALHRLKGQELTCPTALEHHMKK